MKKFLLSMTLMIAFAVVTFAQVPFANVVHRETGDRMNFDAKFHHNRLMERNAKSTESRWYNYALTMNYILNDASLLAGFSLFPDTTINIQFIDGLGTPSFHLMGKTLDPTSDFFNEPSFFPNELFINQYMPYYVDSIGMMFYYTRNHPDPTIVDTLVFELYTDSVPGNFPVYYFGPGSLSDRFNTDTLFFHAHRFNASDLSSKATYKHTYKFPLTEAFANDTLHDGSVEAYVSTHDFPRVQAGRVVGMTAKFIPGYTWIAHVDTLQRKNWVTALSKEENGANTYPTYTKGDANASSVAVTWTLDDPYDQFYELQAPSWVFVQGFRLENHMFNLKLTADVSNINVEQPTQNTLTLSQNQPNPFSNTTTIRYTLGESTNVSFDLFDQTGRKVMSINRGVEAAGMHTLDIDASNLTNGVYFYTLTAGNQRATKKMVVMK